MIHKYGDQIVLFLKTLRTEHNSGPYKLTFIIDATIVAVIAEVVVVTIAAVEVMIAVEAAAVVTVIDVVAIGTTMVTSRSRVISRIESSILLKSHHCPSP